MLSTQLGIHPPAKPALEVFEMAQAVHAGRRPLRHRPADSNIGQLRTQRVGTAPGRLGAPFGISVYHRLAAIAPASLNCARGQGGDGHIAAAAVADDGGGSRRMGTAGQLALMWVCLRSEAATVQWRKDCIGAACELQLA
jgi:hypothetical protein